ncbi:hypothetical protein TNCV_1432161 [Trichonephila clavipes]|nr:hypothetical protein TNCV_1432161 [Trichonephila clavipes]
MFVHPVVCAPILCFLCRSPFHDLLFLPPFPLKVRFLQVEEKVEGIPFSLSLFLNPLPPPSLQTKTQHPISILVFDEFFSSLFYFFSSIPPTGPIVDSEIGRKGLKEWNKKNGAAYRVVVCAQHALVDYCKPGLKRRAALYIKRNRSSGDAF